MFSDLMFYASELAARLVLSFALVRKLLCYSRELEFPYITFPLSYPEFHVEYVLNSLLQPM